MSKSKHRFSSKWLFLIIIFLTINGYAQSGRTDSSVIIGNPLFYIHWPAAHTAYFSYVICRTKQEIPVVLPAFEINNHLVPIILTNLHPAGAPHTLSNKVIEFGMEGNVSSVAGLKLHISFQVSPDNPVLRFRYCLLGDNRFRLTKQSATDKIQYLRLRADITGAREIGLSAYDERIHATHLREQAVGQRYFEDSQSVMGPILTGTIQRTPFLLAYEHGSQYGDRFLQYQLSASGNISIDAVKGNYLSGDTVNNFCSPWFELASGAGSEDGLAKEYRRFVLNYITLNAESRQPYIFYNTWGRQEKKHYQDGSAYLSTANLDQTLKEIDRAHAMGIDVYVIDVGWFNLTGDWEVNTKSFPDTLQAVKRRLAAYGMKLGLWLNPTMAALESRAYKNNITNRMSWNDTIPPPAMVWESPVSSGLCLVSSYWEPFADRLISLVRTLGVSYFKWDGIAQYGCNDAHHLHGGSNSTAEERAQRYAFLQPLYMSKIIDKVVAACPGVIVDFDITEPGRSVGLQFLSSGKYFLLNNGPYFHNFDLAPVWQSPIASGNTNIFVHPGPARGWFLRTVLDYDRWIPSNLFLAHYLPEGSPQSMKINVASLILGQNGVWGDILSMSDSAVNDFGMMIGKYKMVRGDMEQATIIAVGLPGESPEIYEKINPATGRGAVVLFSNEKGDYDYITRNSTDRPLQVSGNVHLTRDGKGRSLIHFHSDGASAAVVFFGTGQPAVSGRP